MLDFYADLLNRVWMASRRDSLGQAGLADVVWAPSPPATSGPLCGAENVPRTCPLPRGQWPRRLVPHLLPQGTWAGRSEWPLG